MNSNTFSRIKEASRLLYMNDSQSRFDVAEETESLIELEIRTGNTDPILNLWFSLTELGIFEELDGALPYLNRLSQTSFKDEATLLLIYGHNSFSPPVPNAIITSLPGLNFKSDTLQSCRFYLEAMTLINGMANPMPDTDKRVEQLLIRSVLHHPSNYDAISYLYNLSHRNRLSISKVELSVIIKKAIEWRNNQSTDKTSIYSNWLFDTEFFFTYSIIKTYDNHNTEMAYIARYKRMLELEYPIL